jgi:UDP-N-acetylmuramate--alanine ligase
MAQKKDLFFIGIGGCGMSSIAHILLKKGYRIYGSDIKESINTIRLRDEGATVYIGHQATNLKNPSIVVVSSAIRQDNPEMVEAKANGLPVFQRAQMLGYLMSQYQNSIACAGTHGKTTSSSLAAVLLNKSGLDPTFIIGGDVLNLGGSALCGNTENFVAEADESDGSIKYLDPKIFLLTNIEKDHLDYFNNLEAIIDLFEKCALKLMKKPDHLLVINSEQWGNKILLERLKNQSSLNITTFGLNDGVNFRAINIRYKGFGSQFTLVHDGKVLGEIELSIPGEHNVLNALAVIAVAFYLNLDFSKIRANISSFTGARRRFTLVGKAQKVSVFDDYAHHPTEIAATLSAARNAFPSSRLVCVFQPHRYSRTMFFMNEFAESLQLADKVVLTHIYAAGENPIPEVDAQTIAKKVGNKAIYIDKKDDICTWLEKELQENDVLFTMGAGDIYTIGKEVLNRLKNKKAQKETNAGKVIRIA